MGRDFGGWASGLVATLAMKNAVIPGEVDMGFNGPPPKGSAWSPIEIKTLSEVQAAVASAMSKKANWVVEKLIERLCPVYSITVEPAAWQRLFEAKGVFEYDPEASRSKSLSELCRIVLTSGCDVINAGRSLTVTTAKGAHPMVRAVPYATYEALLEDRQSLIEHGAESNYASAAVDLAQFAALHQRGWSSPNWQHPNCRCESDNSRADSRLNADRPVDEPRRQVQRRAIFRRDPLGDA